MRQLGIATVSIHFTAVVMKGHFTMPYCVLTAALLLLPVSV